MEDYNKLVEADTSEDESPTYESEYRGKVQNRRTELAPEPALVLTYYTGQSDFQRKMYNKELERLNRLGVLPARLVLTHDEVSLDEARIQKHFSSIQALSDKIARQPDNTLLYLARSIDEYLVQDFEKALADIDHAIKLDSSYLLAYYMRVQIRMKNSGSPDGRKILKLLLRERRNGRSILPVPNIRQHWMIVTGYWLGNQILPVLL